MEADKARYTESHEWAYLEDGIVTMGITEYAVEQVGDIVFVEFEADEEVTKGESFGILETVKAVFDLYAPATGTIAEKNSGLEDDPEKLQSDPTGEGWILKIKPNDPSEIDSLMSLAEYQEFCSKEH